MKTNLTKIASSALLILFASQFARAQEWTQWRGANRDGTVKDFAAPAAWPKELKRKWKVEVGGGYSSPVVAAKRVYLHTRKEEKEIVSAFELETGKQVWTHAYDAPFDKNKYAVQMGKGPNSTPVLHNGRLCTLGVTAILSCFDAETGALKWRKDFSKQIDASKLFTGTAMSPVVEKGSVIAHIGDDRGGSVIAFDAESGREVWKHQGDGPGYASPIVVELAGARQIVTLTDKSAVGIEAATGKLLWRMPFPDEWNENIVTPLLYKNMLILSGVRKGTMAVEIVKGASGLEAKQVWANSKISMYMSSPVLDGDHIYGMSHMRKGQLFCMDARTGELLWATEGREGSQVSVLNLGGAVMFLNENAELIFAAKSRKGFEQLARYTVADSPTWTHPTVVGKGILIKDDKTLSLWAVE